MQVSVKLHISSDRTMEIAESLYQRGYLSYPRTETDKFKEGTDLRSLIEMQTQDGRWAPFAHVCCHPPPSCHLASCRPPRMRPKQRDVTSVSRTPLVGHRQQPHSSDDHKLLVRSHCSTTSSGHATGGTTTPRTLPSTLSSPATTSTATRRGCTNMWRAASSLAARAMHADRRRWSRWRWRARSE